MVINIEWEWLDRILATKLYRYQLPEASFFELEPGDPSGHWVSSQSVKPLSVEPMGNLITRVQESNVELRFTAQMLDMWKLIIQSTMQFSGTRLRNATGWRDDLFS